MASQGAFFVKSLEVGLSPDTDTIRATPLKLGRDYHVAYRYKTMSNLLGEQIACGIILAPNVRLENMYVAMSYQVVGGYIGVNDMTSSLAWNTTYIPEITSVEDTYITPTTIENDMAAIGQAIKTKFEKLKNELDAAGMKLQLYKL
jgi:hypothetical protein